MVCNGFSEKGWVSDLRDALGLWWRRFSRGGAHRVCRIFVDIGRAVLIDAREHVIMIDALLEGLETGLTWETGTHVIIRLARRGLGIRRIFDEFELI